MSAGIRWVAPGAMMLALNHPELVHRLVVAEYRAPSPMGHKPAGIYRRDAQR